MMPRATGVKARLCKSNIVGGTIASADISGWSDAEAILGRRKTVVERLHLLACELGGSGSNPRNLVVGCTKTNKEMWNRFEKSVRDWIRDSSAHVVVDYVVTVEYSGTSVFAKSIATSRF